MLFITNIVKNRHLFEIIGNCEKDTTILYNLYEIESFTFKIQNLQLNVTFDFRKYFKP